MVSLMKVKDYEPINFEFFQSDMEKILYYLQEAIIILGQVKPDLAENLSAIKTEIDCKVAVHRKRGEWT